MEGNSTKCEKQCMLKSFYVGRSLPFTVYTCHSSETEQKIKQAFTETKRL